MQNHPVPEEEPIAGGKLQPWRETIAAAWQEGRSIRAIWISLKQQGCQVSYERTRTWIEDEVAHGRLPPRVSSRVGRPRKQPAAHVSIADASPLALESLEIGPADESAPVGTAAIFPLLPEQIKNNVSRLIGAFGHRGSIDSKNIVDDWHKVGISVDSNSEPDFMKLAQTLGKNGVSQLSGMEFFFLASFLKPWRTHANRWSPAWAYGVLQEAANLKGRMLDAVK